MCVEKVIFTALSVGLYVCPTKFIVRKRKYEMQIYMMFIDYNRGDHQIKGGDIITGVCKATPITACNQLPL